MLIDEPLRGVREMSPLPEGGGRMVMAMMGLVWGRAQVAFPAALQKGDARSSWLR